MTFQVPSYGVLGIIAIVVVVVVSLFLIKLLTNTLDKSGFEQ